jgi:hypothetical protein
MYCRFLGSNKSLYSGFDNLSKIAWRWKASRESNDSVKDQSGSRHDTVSGNLRVVFYLFNAGIDSQTLHCLTGHFVKQDAVFAPWSENFDIHLDVHSCSHRLMQDCVEEIADKDNPEPNYTNKSGEKFRL